MPSTDSCTSGTTAYGAGSTDTASPPVDAAAGGRPAGVSRGTAQVVVNGSGGGGGGD